MQVKPSRDEAHLHDMLDWWIRSGCRIGDVGDGTHGNLAVAGIVMAANTTPGGVRCAGWAFSRFEGKVGARCYITSPIEQRKRIRAAAPAG